MLLACPVGLGVGSHSGGDYWISWSPALSVDRRSQASTPAPGSARSRSTDAAPAPCVQRSASSRRGPEAVAVGKSSSTRETSTPPTFKLKSPILTNQELEKLRRLGGWKGFKARTLQALYKVKEDGAGLETAMASLCAAASEALADGANLLILSDRGV